MADLFEKIFGFDRRRVKKYRHQAKQIMDLEPEIEKLSNEELAAKTTYFRQKLADGAKLDDIKFEAMAVAREAAWRTIKQKPFQVQIVGALVLNDGDVAEMRTGEGKTLTATMSVYLNALEGKGVHVVTVNEYLAGRDAEWMGQIYRFLGLTVGVNIRDKDKKGKQEAHGCDITYTTNSELGFDYLRDNMATAAEDRVLRGLNYAVIDEADSILIDESRTPLIISGGSKASATQYTIADRFVKQLKKDKDFNIDIKTKTCALTETGNDKAEKMFGIKNLYNPEYADLVHRIHQALKANYIMGRDVEYLVDNEGEIQLIDQFTGRILKGREYSDGLQQAIQAKENVKIKQETITLATITYQNFFRLFKKLSGMTGTAKTDEEEFRKIYNMRVLPIPTNRPVIRKDAIDYIFATKEAKLKALVQEIKEKHEKGQPILIGTTSVEASEELSNLLTAEKLPHEVLNAKNHSREAEIVSRAGEKGMITLATNMAGRGTDIKISDEVKALGGLVVFGTERHESRRIDNQLRGRSGRQGDPGYSRFYVSIQDDLMRRFGADGLERAFAGMEDSPLESRMITNAVTGAQKRIEGKNFDTRKNVLDYDDVLSKQRNIIYSKRDDILYSENIHSLIDEMFNTAGTALAKRAVDENTKDGLVSSQLLARILIPRFLPEGSFDIESYDQMTPEDAAHDIVALLKTMYSHVSKEWPEDLRDKLEKHFALRCIDRTWTNHIDEMTSLRDSIYLRSYAQTNPLQDYVNEGYQMFNDMLDLASIEVILNLLNAKIEIKPREEETQEQAINIKVEAKNKEDKSIVDMDEDPEMAAKES